jgi:RNA polymerase sigma-70 factor (ECF subfamily)
MEENDPHERRTGISMSASPEGLREALVALMPRLRRFARALARNVDDADDLVQLALERALTRSGQLKPDAPLSSWMFGIVRNAWLDELRARGRRARVFATEEAGEQVADASQAGHAETLAVQDALSRLPEEQRLAVALVLIEGCSYKEAAHIMEVPIGTLTSRLARGREALQEMLVEGESGRARR